MSTLETARAGRQVVLHELDRRGLQGRDGSGSRSEVFTRAATGVELTIRVSTKHRGDWQSRKAERDPAPPDDPSRWWAFVDLSTDPPLVWLATESDVRRSINESVHAWYARQGHTDTARRDRGHTAITDEQVRSISRPWSALVDG